MKRKGPVSSDTVYAWLYWAGLVLVVLLGVFLNMISSPVTLFSGSTGYQEQNWRFGEKGGPLEPVSLSESRLFEPGKTYVLTTRLTYTGEGDLYPSALVTNSKLEIRAYVDGELQFSHTAANKTIPTVQSVGPVIFPVNLGGNCAGTEFTLELRSPLSTDNLRQLPSVGFGDHASQIRTLFLNYVPSMLISAAITFAVIILTMMGNTADGTQWTYLYFSVFALLIVQYRSMQDLFFVYMWGKPFMGTLFEYFSIAACPIPLLMSCRYRVKPYRKNWFNVLIGCSIALLGVETVAHFTGIRDASGLLLLTHLWLLVLTVILFGLGFAARRELGRRLVFRKLFPILVGAVVDCVLYYLRKFSLYPLDFYNLGDCVGLGLLISLIMMIWEARQAGRKAYRERERNRILEKLAYTDALTGIPNRAAFSRELGEIRSRKYGDAPVLLVSADVNGLKQTNDSQGHVAGDALIQRASSLLSTCLKPWGEVYRTGGDEFFGILHGLTQEDWEGVRHQLELECSRRNVGQRIPLSVAVGHCFLEDGDVHRCIQTADRRMYENKKDCYRREFPGEEDREGQN